jgi:hypothetical protein
MARNFRRIPALVLSIALALPAWAGTEGTLSTFYGHLAGAGNPVDSHGNTFVGASAGAATSTGLSNTFVGEEAGAANQNGGFNTFLGFQTGHLNTSGYDNAFVGYSAGLQNTTGFGNTFLGNQAGISSISGVNNTYVGAYAGTNSTGSNNVFVGHEAGLAELGSHRLYIDNCLSGGSCTAPFIYGEFDNHLLKVNGVLNVRANGAAKSQLHFSQNDADVGGWLTSVLDNNFFASSGARFDSGSWVQRSPDNKAVIAGSGGVGYRIFADSGQAVAASFTPTVRLHIDYSGNLGINMPAVAGIAISTSTGASLTAGGVWTDASSREYKEHIAALTAEEALQAFSGLTPVRYNYKADPEEKHVGFIAEDVPELIARKNRKSLSPMDIVAVLTKVVREQRRDMEEQQRALDAKSSLLSEQQQTLEMLSARMVQMEAQLRRLAPVE